MGALVMVIEDNVDNMSLMTYLLRAFGHEAVEARTGEEGLGLAKARRPDLVVCDLALPGIDGFEVLAQLKTRAELGRVPIIAVTAFAMVGDRERAMKAGFDGYISKPIVPESFVNQLEGFLQNGQRGSDALPPKTEPGDRPRPLRNRNGTNPRR